MLILDLLRRYGEFAGIASLGLMGPRRLLLGGSGKKFSPTMVANLLNGLTQLTPFSRGSGSTVLRWHQFQRAI